jgi:hypothetical protein
MFRLTLFAFCAFLCSAAHSAELLDGLSIEQVFADSNCKINSRRINPLSMGVDHELTLAGKRLFLSIGVYENTEKAEEKFKRVIRTISTSGESVEIGDGGYSWPGSGTTRFRLKPTESYWPEPSSVTEYDDFWWVKFKEKPTLVIQEEKPVVKVSVPGVVCIRVEKAELSCSLVPAR